MNDKIAGSCLCGSVTFDVENQFRNFYFCHCSQCRKITGSAHASNLFAAPDAVTWHTGQGDVETFRHPTRSIAKAFCKKCGSGLPYVNLKKTFTIVPAGSLDETPDKDQGKRIFWHDRAPWHDWIKDAPAFDEFPK
ncbi:GFA family protein [Maritalea sp.]|uniref:GFA family protein n=1 Tax=Maritalea sp. TaxID=2003361 RepID=UPI003EF2F91B